MRPGETVLKESVERPSFRSNQGYGQERQAYHGRDLKGVVRRRQACADDWS